MSTKTLYIYGSTRRIEMIVSALESPNVGLSDAHKKIYQNAIVSSLWNLFLDEKRPVLAKSSFSIKKRWSQLSREVNAFKDPSLIHHCVGQCNIADYPNSFGACGGFPWNFAMEVPLNRL